MRTSCSICPSVQAPSGVANWEAQRVPQAIAGAECAKQERIAEHFDAEDAETALHRRRQRCLLEAHLRGVREARVGNVQRHEAGVEPLGVLQHLDVDPGVAAVRIPNETALAGLLGRLEGLDRAARSEDPLDVPHRGNHVHLPEIDVICLHGPQRGHQVRLGALPGPLARLGGEKDLVSKLRNHGAVDVLGVTVAVSARHIEVVDPEIVSAPHHRFGFIERYHAETGAALADDGELLAGPAERAHGDATRFRSRRSRRCQTRKGHTDKNSSIHAASPPLRLPILAQFRT